MAVTRMHTDPGKSYDPNKELTNNQRRRYSDVANKAEERREQRELYKAALNPQLKRAEAIAKAKAELKKQQDLQTKRRMPELSFLRVLIWSLTLGAFWLWVAFMFPSG
ncbi:hypothetical protein MACH09_34510 [Vibrio sp. MACH09]|uniref:hypothetical protein n=2 Tax=unclassified Vibrio TaxID=2614977 RepID=UPI00149333C8|nr:hypothetical protein [Vibrio sp. 99-8-1]GLO62943.1 hypothetical protein MACH09_34510 [Vibrio sp. MACH09]